MHAKRAVASSIPAVEKDNCSDTFRAASSSLHCVTCGRRRLLLATFVVVAPQCGKAVRLGCSEPWPLVVVFESRLWWHELGRDASVLRNRCGADCAGMRCDLRAEKKVASLTESRTRAKAAGSMTGTPAFFGGRGMMLVVVGS